MLIFASPPMTGNLKLLEPVFGEFLNFLFGFTSKFPSVFLLLGSLVVGIGIFIINKGYNDKSITDERPSVLIEMEDSNLIL